MDKAVIIAGGRGSRMGMLAEQMPKSMLPISGLPLIAHQIEWLMAAGVNDITLLLGYGASVIRSWLEKTSLNNVQISTYVEEQPLGSGGCLRFVVSQGTRLIVLFGDLLLQLDLSHLLRFHSENGGLATIVVHPNDHLYDSDLVEIDRGNRVLHIHRKPHSPDLLIPNRVAAGVFVLNPDLLLKMPRTQAFDLVRDFLSDVIEHGQPVYGYLTQEYVKDVGTPDRYSRACEDWAQGKVVESRRGQRRRAAFIDRDGTISRHVGFVVDPTQIELLPGSGHAIRRLNEEGVLVVVVTNQPVVARGLCDDRMLEAIHARLEMLLGQQNAYIDALYYCPHHPDSGFLGEVSRLKCSCSCRKPKTGLVERAIRELPIELGKSAMFGDSPEDIEMADRLGIGSFRIRPVTAESYSVSDAFPSLAHAVEAWLGYGQ